MLPRWNRRRRCVPNAGFRPSLEGLEDRTLPSFAGAVGFSAQSRPAGMAAGDFNEDGKLDFATANVNSNSASVFLGKGDGTFQAAVNYRIGSDPQAVAVADFNRDGHLDLALTNSNPTFQGNSVCVLFGKGDGTFRDPAYFQTGAAPFGVVAADLDLDGLPDLAVANAFSNTVSVLRGNGDGTFRPAVNFETGTQPRAVTVADFNRDGLPDLAVANSLGNTVSVLLNKGAGTFQSTVFHRTGVNPVALAAADFNGDGVPDLAVADGGGLTSQGAADPGGVSVLLGKGDGGFTAATHYAADLGPASLVVGDFNRDGHPDLATANLGSSTVSVFSGRADGTFGPAVNQAAGARPGALVAGDFNGDHAPDLIAAVTGANNLAFLANQADAAVPAGTTGQRFVAQLYLDLLQRPVDPAGLDLWAGRLDHGTPREQVVRDIVASVEYRSLFVTGLYRDLLRRPVDAAGLQAYVAFLGAGGTELQVTALITGSPEYYARAGNSTAGFLLAAYDDLLGRRIDATGGAAWNTRITAGATPPDVAAGILGSLEARQNQVVNVYQRFLRRDPDDAGFRTYVTALQQGMSDTDFLVAVLASGEYYARIG